MSQCSCITLLFLIEHIKFKFTIALVSCKSAHLFSLVSELLIPNTEAECWFAGLGPPERIVPIILMTWKGNVTESPESLLLTSHHPITQCSQSLRVLIIKEKIYNTILASVSCSYEKQVWFFSNNCRQAPNEVMYFVRGILGKEPHMRSSHRALSSRVKLWCITSSASTRNTVLSSSAGHKEHTHHHSQVILKNFNTNLI